MMSSNLRHRLGAHRLDMSPDHTERAMSAIRAELQLPPRTTSDQQTGSLRRLALAAVAASVLLLPAMAIASDDAVPGDLLFPVKTSVESIWQIVDPEIVGRHRVEEVEQLIQREAPAETIAERIRLAEAVVDASDPVLLARLEQVRRTIQTRTGQPSVVDRGNGAGFTQPQGNTDQPGTGNPQSSDTPGDPPGGTNRSSDPESSPPSSVAESGPTETDVGPQGPTKRRSEQNRDHGG